MEFFSRTDLACEQKEGQLRELRERQVGSFVIRTHCVNEESKAKGRYVTVECGRITMLGIDEKELLARLIAGELRGMCERLSRNRTDRDFCVFLAGLGNAELTADAIGPQTIRRLNATRHLREHEPELFRSIGGCSVCSLAPGVLGQTGIETLEILRSIVNCVHPDVVIVVDALAARSCERLAATVQITDTGIAPGSGVGNRREAITDQALGVPVIALGVPTVVDSSTLVYDALRKAKIEKIDDALIKVLKEGEGFFVSPKDSDLITEHTAELLAHAIGLAFTEALIE